MERQRDPHLTLLQYCPTDGVHLTTGPGLDHRPVGLAVAGLSVDAVAPTLSFGGFGIKHHDAIVIRSTKTVLLPYARPNTTLHLPDFPIPTSGNQWKMVGIQARVPMSSSGLPKELKTQTTGLPQKWSSYRAWPEQPPSSPLVWERTSLISRKP